MYPHVTGGYVTRVVRAVPHRLGSLLRVALVADHQADRAPARTGQAQAELALGPGAEALLAGRRVQQDHVVTRQGVPHGAGNDLLTGAVANLRGRLGLAEPVPDGDPEPVLN